MKKVGFIESIMKNRHVAWHFTLAAIGIKFIPMFGASWHLTAVMIFLVGIFYEYYQLRHEKETPRGMLEDMVFAVLGMTVVLI